MRSGRLEQPSLPSFPRETPFSASARVRVFRVRLKRQTAVHPLSIWSTGLSSVASSDPVYLRHPRLTVYRCSLPGLTGFAASRRAGPSHQRRFPRTVSAVPRPRAGIRPRYSGLRVQGTASSPSSTTASHPITAPNGYVNRVQWRVLSRITDYTSDIGVMLCYNGLHWDSMAVMPLWRRYMTLAASQVSTLSPVLITCCWRLRGYDRLPASETPSKGTSHP